MKKGLPFSMCASLHAIWTPSPPPLFFLHVISSGNYRRLDPPPLSLGAYALNGRPQNPEPRFLQLSARFERKHKIALSV